MLRKVDRLKALFPLLVAVLLASCAAKKIPVAPPASQVAIPGIERDSREWGVVNASRSDSDFVIELLPKGDSVGSWQELLTIEIFRGDDTARHFADTVEATTARDDPGAILHETTTPDGALLVETAFDRKDGFEIQKILRGSDAIYTVVYDVRGAARDEATFALWKELVSGAELVAADNGLH